MTWKPTDTRRETTCTPMDTRGPARLWHHPAGWVMRERGDVDGTVVHDYCCPVHGRFEARVSRRDVPDAVVCGSHTGIFCGVASPWSPSKLGVWASSGEVTG